ncbi:uncharacterized protein DUF4178 [Murinocardiopsis flavida]|uniref:Uncharacterized protein DUF4178 n=1 Tax=Murinocardiopsis flavida TaxID=645275 RepID=A0A2P8DH27_9ACTN|nr:DUF4178 domain-containing protein [Murinocardiopsis flavida]PSK96508.1 uncharacterized protein DUF4178 [Murinocardiopsis flavida]
MDLVLIGAGALAVFVLFVFGFSLAGNRKGDQEAPPADGRPLFPVASAEEQLAAIRPGGTIDFGFERATVTGTLHMYVADRHWVQHALYTPEGHRWLSVEGGATGQTRTVLWSPAPSIDLSTGDAIPAHDPETEAMDAYGGRYERAGRGGFSYESTGDTGLPANGVMDYADFRSAEGGLLSFERFDGGPWRARVGYPVPVGAIAVARAGAEGG